tara:strand:- start:1268 stop:2392 length:1125 start_codon:yes stop_codon:yes gene_type:complete
MILRISDNIKFSKYSGDLNKIHIKKNHAEKYFIKKPIVHGVNIVTKALKKIFKDKDIKTNHLKIEFKDFINTGEYFYFKKQKNNIFINGKFNNKVLISKNYSKQDKIKKKFILDELLYITRYVGNKKPGCNGLIQQIEFKKISAFDKKRKVSVRKISNYFFIINYCYLGVKIEIIAFKLKKFNTIQKRINFSFLKNKFKEKKLLIYGHTGDIGKYLLNSNLSKYISVFKSKFKEINKPEAKKELIKINPDYIIYLLSPRIISNSNMKLLKIYKNVYVKNPYKIFMTLKQYNKNIKFFYPSTVFLNKKKEYNNLKLYISSKYDAEKLFSQKKLIKHFFIFRLPKFKTRSNYDPFIGNYLGEELINLKPYLKKFIS